MTASWITLTSALQQAAFKLGSTEMAKVRLYAAVRDGSVKAQGISFRSYKVIAQTNAHIDSEEFQKWLKRL